MKAEVREYARMMGLGHLDWKSNKVKCKARYCLAIINRRGSGEFYIDIVKRLHWEQRDKYNHWMSSDEEGWAGPVEFVVAWYPLDIDYKQLPSLGT